MASLNKVMLIGNLGKDPELRYTPAGTAVASFSLATSEKFKNKDGEYEEKVDWHNVVLWGRQAEVAGEYLTKGKTIYLEGKLQTRKWQDKDGRDRFTTEVVGERMQMIGGRTEGQGDGQSGSGNQQRSNQGSGNQQQRQGSRQPSSGGGGAGIPGIDDMPGFPLDDIPF